MWLVPQLLALGKPTYSQGFVSDRQLSYGKQVAAGLLKQLQDTPTYE